jgi:hypothetical protein
VEYALGLSLILVASLGAISALEDSASDNITTRGATAGAPDLPDSGIPTTSPTTETPTTPPPPTDPPATVTATASFSNAQTGQSGSSANWSPKIDVEAVDSSTGETLRGVTITVTWTPQPGGAPVTQSCQVPSTGICTFQLTGNQRLNGSHTSVVVAVDSITGTDPVIEYAAGSATTTINGPA